MNSHSTDLVSMRNLLLFEKNDDDDDDNDYRVDEQNCRLSPTFHPPPDLQCSAAT